MRSLHFGEASPVAILAMEEALAKTVAEGSRLLKVSLKTLHLR